MTASDALNSQPQTPSAAPRIDIASGIGWASVRYVLGKLLGILALAVATRHHSPVMFGVLAAVQLVANWLSSVADGGVSAWIVTRWSEQRPRDLATARAVALAFAVGQVAVLLVVGSPLLVWLGVGEYLGVLQLFCIPVVLRATDAVPEGLLKREGQLKRLAACDLARDASQACAVVVVSLFCPGVLGLAAATVVGAVARTCTLNVVRPVTFHVAWQRHIVTDVRSLSAHAWLGGVLGTALNDSDTLIVQRMFGQVVGGQYSLGWSLANSVNRLISSTTQGLALLLLADARRSGSSQAVVQQAWVRGSAAVALPLMSTAAAFSHPLVSIIYGPGWDAAADYLTLFSVFTAIRVFTSSTGSVLIAAGRERLGSVINAGTLLIYVPSLLIASLRGPLAVAATVSGVRALQALCVNIAASRLVGLSPREYLRGVGGILLIATTGYIVGVAALRSPGVASSKLAMVCAGGIVCLVQYWAVLALNEDVRQAALAMARRARILRASPPKADADSVSSKE